MLYYYFSLFPYSLFHFFPRCIFFTFSISFTLFFDFFLTFTISLPPIKSTAAALKSLPITANLEMLDLASRAGGGEEGGRQGREGRELQENYYNEQGKKKQSDKKRNRAKGGER